MNITPTSDNGNHGPFRCDDASLDAILTSVSSERISTYMALADGSERRALQLYARNSALSSAFWGPLQVLEVVLRNTLNGLLAARYGESWYDSLSLGHGQARVITSAKKALNRERKPLTAANVLAASTFGFWVAFLTKANDRRYWRPGLHRAFNPTPERGDVHRMLCELLRLRNRIAHHEPILRRSLRRDDRDILRLLNLMSPPVATWVLHHSRVPQVLATPVSQTHRF